MANSLIQTPYVTGKRPVAVPQAHGEVAHERFYYDFTVAGSTTTYVELGILPAFCVPVDAILYLIGTYTGITTDIGIMSGVAGTIDSLTDTARTIGDEYFDGAAMDDADGHIRCTNIDLAQIAPVEYDRGIGMLFSGTIAASAAKKLWLATTYQQVMKGQP